MRHLLLPLFAAAFSVATPAFATEKQAQECVRATTWDLYADGWNVRSLKAHTLPDQGRDFAAFRVNLLPGNEYMLVSCADGGATSVISAVYKKDGGAVDATGNPVPLVISPDGTRTPRVTFSPEAAGEYLIVVKVSAFTATGEPASVATAVTYR